MNLAMIIGKDGRLLSNRAQSLNVARLNSLMIPIWKEEPKAEVQEVEYGYHMWITGTKETGAVSIGWFIYDVDPLSNTLILCPPIINTDKGTVSFSKDDYDLAARDEGWPMLLVDLADISGYILRQPNNRKALGFPVDVQKEPETVVQPEKPENSGKVDDLEP